MKYIYALLFALVLQTAMAQNVTNGSQLPPTPVGAPLTTASNGANTSYNNTYQSGNAGTPANNSGGSSIIIAPAATSNGNAIYGTPMTGTGSTTNSSTTNNSTTTTPQDVYNNSLNGSPQNMLNGSGGNTNTYDFLDGGTIYSGYGTTSPTITNY